MKAGATRQLNSVHTLHLKPNQNHVTEEAYMNVVQSPWGGPNPLAETDFVPFPFPIV